MIRIALSQDDFNYAAQLFREYANWLNVDLDFQHFDDELSSLSTMYGPPYGRLFLYHLHHQHVACVAVRKIDEGVAELKRMYVLEPFRNKGIAKSLLQSAVEFAKAAGYECIRLDTLSTMTPAMNLYTKYGFKKIDAYYDNPIETAVYFELKLQ